jgi:acyl dehydratase
MTIGNLEPVSLEKAQAAVGSVIGVSPWRIVSQEMIDKFADATDDHQFIHVDPARAAAEAPFGGTIAHGFLSLSLLSTLAYESIPPIANTDIGVNYGFDRVRFVTPVRSGARVRGRFVLAQMTVRPSGWIHFNYDVTIEVEGAQKPALTARWLTLARLLNNQRGEP